MLVMTVGRRVSGNRRMVNRDKATKAFSESRTFAGSLKTNVAKETWKTLLDWALVVAQLAEQLLPKPEVCEFKCQSLVNFCNEHTYLL